MDTVLLMFKMKLSRIPSAGVVGCALAFLALLQGWLCVGVLCTLQMC